MAELLMCEPVELYNLLNQVRRVCRLAEANFLCLLDARETQDYNVSHIITAKNAKMDADGSFLLPEAVEVGSMQHVLVYDSNTCCLQEQGRAVRCAQVLAYVSRHPVRIVSGGFQRFSALYTFLRTEKLLYTITELENIKTYPVEVIAGQLFMGDLKQGTDPGIIRDLKISAVISISQSNPLESFKGSEAILNIPVADSAHGLKGSYVNTGSRVLVISRQGRSRCSAVTIAFLMHHLKYTLEDSWKHVLRCKPDMRPNTSFLQQLSAWELHTSGATVTDVSGL
ncbi:serine/threonine/tyrosine-interacting-like protein 1 [Aulostomus maculatus]